MFYAMINFFQVTFCAEDFQDLDFPANYPSDEEIPGNRLLIIFDSACNAFNFVCLSRLEPEIMGVGNLPTPHPTYTPEPPRIGLRLQVFFYIHLGLRRLQKIS